MLTQNHIVLTQNLIVREPNGLQFSSETKTQFSAHIFFPVNSRVFPSFLSARQANISTGLQPASAFGIMGARLRPPPKLITSLGKYDTEGFKENPYYAERRKPVETAENKNSSSAKRFCTPKQIYVPKNNRSTSNRNPSTLTHYRTSTRISQAILVLIHWPGNLLEL